MINKEKGRSRCIRSFSAIVVLMKVKLELIRGCYYKADMPVLSEVARILHPILELKPGHFGIKVLHLRAQ